MFLVKQSSLNALAREFVEQLISAVLDEKGNYIFVSRPWQEWFGKTTEEVLGRNVLEFAPDSHAMEVLRTGEPVTAQRVMSRDTPVFTSYLPRLDKNGNVCGVFLYVVVEGVFNARDMIRQIEVMANEVDYYKEELSRERGARYGLDSIVGNSPVILNMKNQIIQAAKSSSTVLIEGETGSGKELIAHSIHALSARRTANFVRVNCSAIPAELMESEFFGYSAGAFTGALKKGKIGRFELANSGTIFLDEVNLLTPTIQPKFLRVLQEMEIDPVGSDCSRSIDVRVIAATNVPLEQLVEEKKFRSNLYWRLNVLRIQAPPLRDRMEDIPVLAESIIRRLNIQLGMAVRGVSKGVLEVFSEYDWPGNVRELQNAIDQNGPPIIHDRKTAAHHLRIYPKLCNLHERHEARKIDVRRQQTLKRLYQANCENTNFFGQRPMCAAVRFLSVLQMAQIKKRWWIGEISYPPRL